MSRRDLGAEILCRAKGCDSHFVHGLGDGWDHPRGLPGHFHHIMLIAVRDHDKAVNDYCPACGRTDGVRELRRVPGTHAFALGEVGFGVELNDAITAQLPGRRGLTPPARALQAQVRGRLESYARGQFPKTEDGHLNAAIAHAEHDLQRTPQERERILQFYDLVGAHWAGRKLYILTEAGRHQTTIAFAEEY